MQKDNHLDFQLINDDPDFDSSFFLSPFSLKLSREAAIEKFMGQLPGAITNRKPCAGFNPHTYAQNSLRKDEIAARNPFAHFIEKGKPQGRWLTPLIRPGVPPGPTKLRTALQIHAFYPELIDELLACLRVNSSRCDLFVSTGSEHELKWLRERLQNYGKGEVHLSMVPNRGRDIGAFLTGYNFLDGKYDLVGHVHCKKSLYGAPEFGEHWRRFLWLSLVGREYSMLDVAARAFEDDAALGLLFPDDPNLVGWTSNRIIAAQLAERMKLNLDFSEGFEFPAGSMFWCRPVALRPLFELKLSWSDYPVEPLANDGTILHAIERMLPFIAEHEGYRFAAIKIPGLTNVVVSQSGLGPVTEADPLEQTVEIVAEAATIRANPMKEEVGAGQDLARRSGDLQAILQTEIHHLWNSWSWRLLRPLRNLARKRQGLPAEREPVALSEVEAIQTLITIRGSLSWELTAPLRLIDRIVGTRKGSAPAPTSVRQSSDSERASSEEQTLIPQSEPTPEPSVLESLSRIEPEPEAFGRITYLKEVIAPLKLDVSARTTRRVNIVVSTIDFKYLYGGYLAVFSLALQLSEQGYRTRLVITDPCEFQPEVWRERVKGYPPLAGLFDRVEIEYRYDRSRALKVSPTDAFLATSWWTAHVAHQASRQLKQARFVYLTQEYEPMFYEAGSMHALAEQSYSFPHYALFSTEFLREFSREHGIGVYSAADGSGDANSISFQNAIGPYAISLERLRHRSNRRLLFYARPERHAARNLFELGVIALSEAVAEGLFDTTKWQFDGIGTLHGRTLGLADRIPLTLLPRVTLEEYIELLPSYDLGLSLMLSPHPSLVPLDMAAAGLITVTNTYENKTSQKLKSISNNIIPVQPTAQGIKSGLVEALRRVDDFEGRVAGAEINWQRRWSEALGGPVMEKLKWFIDHPNVESAD
jgi:hypothetical protein